jgi:hypothetical protein
MLGLGAVDVSPSPQMGGLFGLGAALGLGRTETSPFGALNTSLGGTGTSPFGVLNTANSNSISISSSSDRWEWITETLPTFLSQLEVHYVPSRIVHKRPDFGSFYLTSDEVMTKASTPPILMTAAVWNGFKRAKPNSSSVQRQFFKKVTVTVPGYTDVIFGGQAEFPHLRR